MFRDGRSDQLGGPAENHISGAAFGIRINAPDNKMSGKHFGGISMLPNGAVRKTYIISPNSTWITSDDVLPPPFACSYPGGHMQACNDIGKRLSGAAGKISIEICRCDKPISHGAQRSTSMADTRETHHPKVFMSGFWIQGDRFVTSAHFLDVISIPAEHQEQTITYQKTQDFSETGRAKAVVSSQDKVNASTVPNKPIHVYLTQLDRDSDLAVFQAYDDGMFDADQPPSGLTRDDVVPMAACDKSQGGYTIGYYGLDRSIHGITPYDENVLTTLWPQHEASRPKSYFNLKYAGATGRRDDSVQFRDVFQYPNHRTISIGEFGGAGGDSDGVLSRHKNAIFMACQFTAWYQSSGGMVGGFAFHNKQQPYRPVICGTFRGDGGRDNNFAAFTDDGIEWLFNGPNPKMH